MSHDQLIEVILFSLARPLTIKRLAEASGLEIPEVEQAIPRLQERLQQSASALQVVQQGNEVELVNRPEFAELLRTLLKSESQAELTRPSLEALAILAYRGPMTRPELEQIRGVQSSMILRNLMLRGLVEMKEDVRLGQPLYAVTIDFLKFLGVQGASDLPDYESLHAHQVVERMMQELQSQTAVAESQSSSEVAPTESSPDASIQV